MNRSQSNARARTVLRVRRRGLLRAIHELDEAERTEHELPTHDRVDRASKLETEHLLHSVADAERRELAEVEAALERARTGTFGMCESCGRAIERRRLDAVPEARTCVGCAAGHAAERSGQPC